MPTRSARQEASPQIQGGSGPLQAPSRQNNTEDPTEDSTDEPTEGTDSEPGRPRVLHRIAPQSMTPEQTEEAERLRRLGAKYGTDPTAIVGRVQLSGEYRDFPQAVKGAAAVARVDLPFRGNYLLRVGYRPSLPGAIRTGPALTVCKGSAILPLPPDGAPTTPLNMPCWSVLHPRFPRQPRPD